MTLTADSVLFARRKMDEANKPRGFYTPLTNPELAPPYMRQAIAEWRARGTPATAASGEACPEAPSLVDLVR